MRGGPLWYWTLGAAVTIAASSCSLSGLVPEFHAHAAVPGSELAMRAWRGARLPGTWTQVPELGWALRPFPADDPRFRPLVDHGRWHHTEFGWIFAPDDQEAGPLYQYGYWHHDSQRGWLWIPGLEWRPANALWRRGEAHVAWAPEPPPGSQQRPFWFVIRARDWEADNAMSRLVSLPEARAALASTAPASAPAPGSGEWVGDATPVPPPRVRYIIKEEVAADGDGARELHLKSTFSRVSVRDGQVTLRTQSFLEPGLRLRPETPAPGTHPLEPEAVQGGRE
jgi:hypothetical protein